MIISYAQKKVSEKEYKEVLLVGKEKKLTFTNDWFNMFQQEPSDECK